MMYYWLTLLAQAQVQAQPGAPGQAPAAPPLQPLPHPELPQPVLVTPGLPWWVYAVAGVVIVLLLGVVLWLLLRPQKAGPPPLKQPWQAAMTALFKLRESAAQMPPADMAPQVSEVLRRYFLERYGIPAPFRTTQEIFHRQELPPASQRLSRYAPLADLWDQLSFAPVPGNSVEAAGLVNRAIICLEEDKP